MGIVAVGLSHKTAPVELRERLAIPEAQMGEALTQLQSRKGLKEAVILSTCNRLEVYARPESDRKETIHSIQEFIQQLYKQSALLSSIYHFEALDAVQHLFRVSAGLDSLVVGEGEVLGQVKSAYQFAQKHGSTGKITNVLFQRALYVGKQVRSNTNIARGSSSVGSMAVHLAERIFGSLQNHNILILGAGKMAELTARHLISQKATHVSVLNRTIEKAAALATMLNGSAGNLTEIEKELLNADIVLCSASVEAPLVTKLMMEPIMKARRERSIYFIDIAVPRNVEADVHDLDNAYVYNIDDLEEVVSESLNRRKRDIAEAEMYVTQFANEFYEWIAASLEGRFKALSHDQKPFPQI